MVRLRIVEDYEGELGEKSGDLLKAVAEHLGRLSPEAHALAILIKSRVQKEMALKYPALHDLQKRAAEIYESQMRGMVREIGAVLDRGVEKAEAPAPAFNFLEEYEKLSKGDRAFITDEMVRREALAQVAATSMGEAVSEFRKGQASFVDHTKAVYDKDHAKYLRVRGAFKLRFKTEDADFDAPSGRYYGKSVNELLEILELASS